MSNIQISIKQEKPDFGKEFSRIKDSFKQTDLSPLLKELRGIKELLSHKDDGIEKALKKLNKFSLPKMPDFNDKGIVSAINSLKASLKEKEKESPDNKMFEKLLNKLNKLNLPTSISVDHKMPKNEAMLKELRSIKQAIDSKPTIVPYIS